MKTRNVIDDGFTRDGRIAPVEGLHDGCEFKFRPLVRSQYEAIDKKYEQAGPQEREDLLGAVIAKHLIEWSEVDGEGNARPVLAKHAAKLGLVVQRSIYDMCCGFQPSDTPVSAAPKEQDDYLDSLVSCESVEESPGN